MIGNSNYEVKKIFEKLLSAKPERTEEVPRDCRGLYGLIDHTLQLRYIGSTRSTSQTFYDRIHYRHRSGSEDRSHYFSRMYNSGRMWRDRRIQSGHPDAAIVKRLKNAFISDHCGAVWVPLEDDCDIFAIEAAVLEIAASENIAWNRKGAPAYTEPTRLVDKKISRLNMSEAEMAALERQRARYAATTKGPASAL